MRLKIYDLKDPRTNVVEEVYEYPSCISAHNSPWTNCTIVSRTPLLIPIIIVPNAYLTEKPNQRISVVDVFLITEYLNYWLDEHAKLNS